MGDSLKFAAVGVYFLEIYRAAQRLFKLFELFALFELILRLISCLV
jgi:hypothetical protein